MSEILRVIVAPEGIGGDFVPVVAEFEADTRHQAYQAADRALTDAGAFTTSCVVVMEWVGPWFPATWGALLPGDEVEGEDGHTWVVVRHLHPGNPHEVELCRLEIDVRFVFTPQYDQPVTARRTPEAATIAMLMERLGARPL